MATHENGVRFGVGEDRFFERIGEVAFTRRVVDDRHGERVVSDRSRQLTGDLDLRRFEIEMHLATPA